MQQKDIRLEIPDDDARALKSQFTALVEKIEDQKFVTDRDIAPISESLTELANSLPDFSGTLKTAHESGEFFVLRLMHRDPEILNLPWPLARDENSGRRLADLSQVCLAKSMLSETGEPFAEADREPAPLPLKILVMISSPPDATQKDRLSYEAEEMSILRAFEPLLKSGNVEIHFTNNGSLAELERKIRENRFHVLHYSGHGAFKDGEGYLQLEDEFTLKAAPVRGSDFAKALLRDDHRIPLVMLAACQTAAGSVEKGFHSVSRELFRRGFPTVAAMSMSVLDNYATRFAETFYTRLTVGESVHRAFRDAGARVEAAEREDMKSIGAVGIAPFQYLIPNLYTRTSEFRLFDADAERQDRHMESYRYILKNSRFHKNIPDFTFIGRRLDKSEVLKPLFDHRAVLLKGMGGVGKTALAIHLAQRYIARRPETEPFFFNEENKSSDDVLRALKKQLVGLGESLSDFSEELDLFDTGVEQIGYLAGRILDKHGRTPLFIFDNLEDFQSGADGAFLPEHADMAELIEALAGDGRFPVILTGRYGAELANISKVRDLNQIGVTDFWKKCLELDVGKMAAVDRKRFSAKPSDGNRVTFIDIVEILHRAFGGNFRALEFFNEIYKANPGEVLGTIEKLAKLPDEYERETLIRMSENLVFSELVGQLDGEQRDILFLLSHFGIPVQTLALELQYHAGERAVPENLPGALKILQNRTLVEVSRNVEDVGEDRIYFYVTPIIKGLLKIGGDDGALKAGRLAFSHQSAGEYYYAIFENGIDAGLTEFAEAFEHFFTAGDKGKVQEIGKRLAGYYYRFSFYQNALVYCLKAEQVCGEETDGWFYNSTGTIFHMFGKYDEALPYFHKSLADYKSKGDRSNEGTTLNNISQIYDARGDYETALKYLEDCLRLFQEIGDRVHEGGTLNNISQIYAARDEYETALTYLKESLEIRREIGDRSGEGRTLNNIGKIFIARGDYETALKYLRESLEIRREIDDLTGEGTILSNMGSLAYSKGDYETALTYLKESLEISREIDDRSGEGTTLNNIGQIFKARGDYETALKYLKESLEIRREIGDTGICATLINIGHIHLENGEQPEAMGSWVSAYTIASRIGHAQALGALENLGKQLGGDGLAFWEELARRNS